MGESSQSGNSELRFGLPRVVVVRDHDFALWVAAEPQGDGGFHGHFDSDHRIDLHLPIVAELQRVDEGGERIGGRAAEEGETGGHCGAVLQLRIGDFGSVFRSFDKEDLGEYVHG